MLASADSVNHIKVNHIIYNVLTILKRLYGGVFFFFYNYNYIIKIIRNYLLFFMYSYNLYFILKLF